MARYVINPEKKLGKINKEIYGHFSEHLGRCIYEGLFVGKDSAIPNTDGMRNDVVDALKKMKLPVLRWPGGCFADTYHWKDGVGPQEGRKKIVNYHWGGTVEDNSFGTNEFFRLCELIGCEPYINGNLGSGTVQEMAEWVEYMTFDGVSPMADLRKANGHEKPWKVKYFGVGNENWGCGGNMRPEAYADLYRRYQTYLQNYSGNKLYKIACGPNVDDYEWTEGVMKVAGKFADGLSLHYYTYPYDFQTGKGSATQFDEECYYLTLKKTLYMEELIEHHTAIMDRYDPEHRVGLIIDEWGTWFDVEPGTNPGFLYQQNTMRDALVAGINLNLFNKHCDRVAMANIAQLVNVLQSVILTDGEDMLLTPTYHVFDLYQVHQEAQLVESSIESELIGIGEQLVPNLYESASVDADGKLNVTVCNLSTDTAYELNTLVIDKEITKITGDILTNRFDAYNTFEEKQKVRVVPFTEITKTEEGFTALLPACSVVRFIVE